MRTPQPLHMSGAIAELARRALSRDFRAIRTAMAKVLLIEAGPRILPSFPQPLAAYAQKALAGLGVTVLTGRAVTGCTGEGVELGSEQIGARTTVWAAGVMASPAADWLGVGKDRAGRTLTAPDLSVPGLPQVFVVGDAVHLEGADGSLVPGIAPAAKQEGAYVGRLIAARIAGHPASAPFRYKDSGSLATVGRQAAVVALGPLRLTGVLAWLFWSAAHVYFLIGFRNRLVVTLDWIWAYLTFERGARLITSPPPVASTEPGARMTRPRTAA